MDTQTIYRRRWVILSVLIVSLLAIVIDNTVLNVALKTIAEPRGGLGASQSQLEWAINSYTLVFAGLLFTFGVIGDKVGRKRMLIIGLVLFGVASLLSAYSRTPDQLIFARAAMGLGAAAVMPQTLSIISNVFEPAERPRAIGLWAMAVGIGFAIGPVLGGVLLDRFWWGSVFLINVPVTALGALAAIILVPESRNHEAGGIDYVGVLLSIAGLVLLVYGIVQGGDIGSWVHPGVLGPIIGGLVILAVFGWWETRVAHPSLDVRLFRDPRLSASVGSIALVFFGVGGVYFFTSFYLQNVRGYSPLVTGLLTVPFAVGQLRSRRAVPPWSRGTARRPRARRACSSSPPPSRVRPLGTDSPIWVIGVLFAIQGAAIGVVMPAATAAVIDVVPRERAGAGFSLSDVSARSRSRSASPSWARSWPGSTDRAQPLAGRPARLGAVAASSSITATRRWPSQLGTGAGVAARPGGDTLVHPCAYLAGRRAGRHGRRVVVLRWMPAVRARPPRSPRPARTPTRPSWA